MNFKEYQEAAHSFAAYKGDKYPQLAIIEELGELYTYLSKHERGDEKYADLSVFYDAMVKEAGDVLWMFSEICDQLGISLNDVAKTNISKLSKRKVNDTLIGDGDDR